MTEEEALEISKSFCDEMNDHICKFIKNKVESVLKDNPDNSFEHVCVLITSFLKTLAIILANDSCTYNKAFGDLFPSKEDVCKLIMRNGLEDE